MDGEVLGVVHHILLAEAGMRLVVEVGRLRVVGNLEQEEEVQGDSRRIDQGEDHQAEDNDLVVEVGNILLEEERLEERQAEDIRILVEGRGVVLEEDSQPEALQNANVNIRSAIGIWDGTLTRWGSIV